jgi:hypothetical protein
VQEGCVKKDVPFLQFFVTFSFFEEFRVETVDHPCPNKVAMLQYRPLELMRACLMAGRLTLDQLASILGSGEMASHHALDVRFEVRILAPQLQSPKGDSFFTDKSANLSPPGLRFQLEEIQPLSTSLLIYNSPSNMRRMPSRIPPGFSLTIYPRAPASRALRTY